MKKFIAFSIAGVVLMSFIPLKAQFEITPSGGYMLGGQKNGYVVVDGVSYNTKYKIENGATWGITAGYKRWDEVSVIFLYSRMDTRLTRNVPYEGKQDLTDLATEYFQIGTLKEIAMNDIVKPFGVFTMGATVFTPKNSGYYTEWLFSMILGGGLRIYFMEHFALQLQARMLMPMVFGGGGLWCGTGGCSVGVGTYSAIVQGDFTGGLVISF